MITKMSKNQIVNNYQSVSFKETVVELYNQLKIPESGKIIYSFAINRVPANLLFKHDVKQMHIKLSKSIETDKIKPITFFLLYLGLYC